MSNRGSATERPHVLIVTDDRDLGDFLGEGLVYGGFWTSLVASGIQTLEIFRLRTFDLILIDATLSGMGALEVIRRLRGRSDRAASDTPRTDVPILMVTTAPHLLEPQDAAAAGAEGILAAPLDLEELVPRLHAVVASWRAEHRDWPAADQRPPQAPERG